MQPLVKAAASLFFHFSLFTFPSVAGRHTHARHRSYKLAGGTFPVVLVSMAFLKQIRLAYKMNLRWLLIESGLVLKKIFPGF
jgi:hypothetical protein